MASVKSKRQRQLTRFNDYNGGVQDLTSPFLLEEDESPYMANLDIRRPGVLAKASGYSQVGSTGASGDVDGLFVFRETDGTRTLMKYHGTTLYKWTGSAWSSVGTGLPAVTQKVVVVNAYIDDEDRVYFTANATADLQYYDGSTVSSISGYGCKALGYYRNRLYLGSPTVSSTTYPQRVLFSGIGVDTFDNDADYFDDMGEPIIALNAYGGRLYIYSEYNVSRYDGYSLVPIPGNFGTTSQQTVQICYGRLTWFNRQGVFMYGGAESPTLISRQIQGWIDSLTSVTNIVAGVDAYDRYLLYVGDITYEGDSYSDVVFRYDPLINAWDILPDRPFGVMTRSEEGGSYTTYAGDTDNDKVWKVDDGTSLNSAAIDSEYQTQWIYFGEPDIDKRFYRVDVSFKPTGESEYLTMEYRLDGASDWETIEGTANNISLSGDEQIATQTLRLKEANGRGIQFRVKHSSSSAGFTLYDISIEYDQFRPR